MYIYLKALPLNDTNFECFDSSDILFITRRCFYKFFKRIGFAFDASLFIFLSQYKIK